MTRAGNAVAAEFVAWRGGLRAERPHLGYVAVDGLLGVERCLGKSVHRRLDRVLRDLTKDVSGGLLTLDGGDYEPVGASS